MTYQRNLFEFVDIVRNHP